MQKDTIIWTQRKEEQEEEEEEEEETAGNKGKD